MSKGEIMSSVMKAVVVHKHGGPEVLSFEDVARPRPAPGEVLIRIRAAGVNPVDWKTRAGSGIAGMLSALPWVLGWDVSGVVEELGAGTEGFKKGDEVYGMVGFPKLGGAYAEYTTAPASHVALKPKTLDHIHAAAVPLAALTAWQALFDTAGLQPGQTILIHAAGGGVGHFAVQLAKWKGARVIGTASSRHTDFLKALGVDQVINYEKEPFEQLVKNVDVVLDTMSGETLRRSFPVLRKGGTLVSLLGQPPADLAKTHGVQAKWMLVKPHAPQLTALANLIDEARLKPAVEAVWPLQDAAKGHAKGQEGHTRGKLVLQVG